MDANELKEVLASVADELPRIPEATEELLERSRQAINAGTETIQDLENRKEEVEAALADLHTNVRELAESLTSDQTVLEEAFAGLEAAFQWLEEHHGKAVFQRVIDPEGPASARALARLGGGAAPYR